MTKEESYDLLKQFIKNKAIAKKKNTKRSRKILRQWNKLIKQQIKYLVKEEMGELK